MQLRLKICEEHDEELQLEDSLWDLNQRQISYHLQHINDELGFGYKGAYRFLRPHTLRKFHASNIGLSEDNIDLLQGRSRDSVHETYIKTNPSEFKKVYMNVMNNVEIKKLGKKAHYDSIITTSVAFFLGYVFAGALLIFGLHMILGQTLASFYGVETAMEVISTRLGAMIKLWF